jgi:phosphotriesterase-related protein
MEMSAISKQIVTVRGPLPPAELGVTMSHDHVLFDPRQAQSIAGTDYASILDDEELAISELIRYREAGGRSICDPTNIGLSRDPAALRRISIASDVHIVMGTGWYREAVYPPYVYEKSVSWLADILKRDLAVGADESDVRAGFIGEIGTERRFIGPAQERVFRAAARAARETGAPVLTHTTHWGELALEQLALLEEEGVDPTRVIVSHLGDRPTISNILPIAARGAWLSIDNLGAFLDYIPLEVRAANVARLWEAGYGNRIVLGNDVCSLQQLRFYGGGGYGHVLENFVPVLATFGIGDSEVQQMLVANPAEAYSWR